MPTENRMPRTLGIGRQDFEKIRRKNNFYEVTLITRPRRFGKTLAMSMVEKFFSIHYWKDCPLDVKVPFPILWEIEYRKGGDRLF